MTDEQLNKRLHEIMGLCWHECKLDNPVHERLSHYKCETCGLGYIINRNLVNNWKGFGILWEFMQKQGYPKEASFRSFVWLSEPLIDYRWENLSDAGAYPKTLIFPPAFAKAVVAFFEGEV